MAEEDTSVAVGTAGHLVFDIEYDERACYALSINRRPPIRSLTIRNVDGHFEGPLTIRVSSEWTASDRPPIRELILQVDCPPVGEAVELDLSESRLDDIALSYLDERSPAEILISAADEFGHTETMRKDILVLARNQWLSSLFEVTAAFVQSQHPAISDVLADASALLKERFGDGSIAGYQGSEEYAVALGHAIFDALKPRITTYLGSPPRTTFDVEGQRVRPFDQLLDSGQGNCIELACAYSACLYAAGLHPVIFLLHGHAFAGFYVSRRASQEGWQKALTTEFASIINVMDRQIVVPVETTAIASEASFGQAIEAVAEHFVERQDGCPGCLEDMAQGLPPSVDPHMEAVVDIRRAFQEGVNVLPVRRNVAGEEHIYIFTGNDQPVVVERRDPVTKRILANAVPSRIQKWKNALLDIGTRSPLINFSSATRGIEVMVPPGAMGDVEDYLIEGGQVRLYGDRDISSVLQAAGITSVTRMGAEDLTRSWQTGRILYGGAQKPRKRRASGSPEESDGAELQPEAGDIAERGRELNRKARESEDELGVNTLHAALGMITWRYPRESRLASGAGQTESRTTDVEVTSPIFLVPIRMNVPRGDAKVAVQLAEDSMTSVNYSLIEALRSKLGLKLEWFNEDMADDSGLDVQRGIDEIRKEIMTAGWADKGVRVDDSMAIGVFPFQKVRIWKDLNDHWEDFLANPVVRHMVEVGTGSFHDPADPEGRGCPPFDDSSLLNPQPADGAQTRAIVRALAGQSFVLEGPPGTGKSQTITNLLANALAHGMKVLFVAEKPDARSVVRERLQQVGLDPFCLDLHDQGSKPQEVKDQIREALDYQPFDVEQEWADLDERYRAVSAILASYRDRVHGAGPTGRSYYDSYETLLKMAEGPQAGIGRGLASMPQEEVAQLRDLLLGLPAYADPAAVGVGHAWAFVPRVPSDDVNYDSLGDAVRGVASSLPAVQGITGPWGDAFDATHSPGELSTLVALARMAEGYGVPSLRDLSAASRGDWQESSSRALESLGQSWTAALALSTDISAALLARNLESTQAQVLAAANSFVMGRKGKVSAALGDLAQHPLFAGKDPAAVSRDLTQLAEVSRAYRESIDRLRRCEGMDIRLLDDQVDPAVLEILRRRQADIRAVADAIARGGDFAEHLARLVETGSRCPAADQFSDLSSSLDRLVGVASGNGQAESEWLAGRTLPQAVAESLSVWSAGLDGNRFLSLRRWLDLLEYVAPLETELLATFRGQLLRAEVPSDSALDAFERAQVQAILTVTAEDNNFDVFDQHAQDRAVQRFVELTDKRQEVLQKLIPARLHAKRRFDSGSGAGAVASLRTELSSKRRGARSVRKLISNYPGLISELTPCFLMGPDSVAKFVPPGSIDFDLVVFDEASQLLVEETIGAMGRAKSVVVVGDSKQMPPSVGFRTVINQSDDDIFGQLSEDIIEDGESLLEETVESGLTRETLSWHYRSQDEALIAFSNEHYYEGRLGTFPSPQMTRPGVGITYHLVPDGQFIHSSKAGDAGLSEDVKRAMAQQRGGEVGTNPGEADAIVAEIRSRVHDPVESRLSIGVVTLNKAQADLIRRKLVDLKDPAVSELLDSEDNSKKLLVLNLESVQGRERDVIILGTSFSKRQPTDDKMPLNFGPLTQKGGERRLNVAVTRARRQVVVYSSFDPELLARAGSQGIRDLHDYLVMAKTASQDRDALDRQRPGALDPYRDEVAAALEVAGLTARTSYGLSHFKVDIAVGSPDRPGEWLVGVLLDGRDWADRPLVLDRDGLPFSVLTGMMGWPAVLRVWLPAWQRDKQEIVDAVRELVDVIVAGGEPSEALDVPEGMVTHSGDVVAPAVPEPAIAQPPAEAPAVRDPSAAAVTPAVSPAATSAPRSSTQMVVARPYVPIELEGRAGSPDDLEHSGAVISQLLESVANAHGPVPLDEALKAVARVFGLDRVREARLEVMRPSAPQAHLVRTPFGLWLFPEECVVGGEVDPARFDWYFTSKFPERKVDHISPQEIANAALPVVSGAFEIDGDELVNALLELFGYARKTNETRAQVRAKIEWAVSRDIFSSSEGVISIPRGPA